MSRTKDTDGFIAEDPSCWISPAGKVTFVNEGSHCSVARDLGDERAGRGLEEKGYLHVSYSSVMKGWGSGNDGREIDPTQAQLDALWDISVRVEKALNDSEDYCVRRYRKFIEDNPVKETL
jgi:hypothetical protein